MMDWQTGVAVVVTSTVMSALITVAQICITHGISPWRFLQIMLG